MLAQIFAPLWSFPKYPRKIHFPLYHAAKAHKPPSVTHKPAGAKRLQAGCGTSDQCSAHRDPTMHLWKRKLKSTIGAKWTADLAAEKWYFTLRETRKWGVRSSVGQRIRHYFNLLRCVRIPIPKTIHFLPVLLRYNWHITCTFKAYNMIIWYIYIYCKMITVIKLVNTFITSQRYVYAW